MSATCDGQADCTQGSDEDICDTLKDYYYVPPSPPAVVKYSTFDFKERIKVLTKKVLDSLVLDFSSLPESSVCPHTHFQCPERGYCLPVFMRCNGMMDCPGKEDEADCGGSYTCPGFYRCRGSRSCLHSSHLCDGIYQCPQKEDEVLCHVDCPSNCTCHGLAFQCHQPFNASLYPGLRYLHAAYSTMKPDMLTLNVLLVHLGLAHCGLDTVGNLTLPNLHSLDLAGNKLHTVEVSQLKGLLNLRRLSLAANPLHSLLSAHTGNVTLAAVTSLDLSGAVVKDLHTHRLSPFPSLVSLNLSQCGVTNVWGRGLHHVVPKLQHVDVVGCPLPLIPRDLLLGLEHLQTVRADNFKLCCPAMLPPSFNYARCQAPRNEVSSCKALLRSNAFRIFLSLFSILTLLGNLGSFLLRSFHIQSTKSAFGVFVTHLCVSDFLMGVYLAVVGVADRLYLGSYLWEDMVWRHSVACQSAGFLSLVSCEVSALIICLITLDRFLVLRFPFQHVHFSHRSVHVVCGMSWAVGVVLASVPLMPMASHWALYSQTGICVPLPTQDSRSSGHAYVFGVLILLNLALLLVIAVGQAVIYWTVRASSLTMAGQAARNSREVRVARRLITVAVSDFLCWFPIGVLGLLASQGTPVPGEVNVGMAIFVLPLNSALNPCLYTFNVVVERQRRARDDKLMRQLLDGLEQETHGTR